jgi:hypothetical protein
MRKHLPDLMKACAFSASARALATGPAALSRTQGERQRLVCRPRPRRPERLRGGIAGIAVASAPVATGYLAGESDLLAIGGYAVVAGWGPARLAAAPRQAGAGRERRHPALYRPCHATRRGDAIGPIAML